MQETITALLRLQELEITMKEVKIVHGESGDEYSKISADIESTRESIDVDTLARYDRLAKHGLSIVKVRNGMCLGCNMTIPVGDLNRMKADESRAPVCPNCARFLNLE